MKIYVSLRQLLLYQMGYLLFNKLKDKSSSKHEIMDQVKTLQTAFEQIKSYKNNKFFSEFLEYLHFDLDDDELKELEMINKNTDNIIDNDNDIKDIDNTDKTTNNINNDDNTPIPSSPPKPSKHMQYIHPFGFGMWLEEQTFVDLGFTGTMDDSETTKQIWRQLTGVTFIKRWKKNKITKNNIIQNHKQKFIDKDDQKTNEPYIDISISNNSVVQSKLFRISLCHNRLFQIEISTTPSKSVPIPSLSALSAVKSRPSSHKLTYDPKQIKSRPSIADLLPPVADNNIGCAQKNQKGRRTRASIDNGTGYTDIFDNGDDYNKTKHNISKKCIDFYDLTVNQNVLRVVCCMLFEPKLCIKLLNILISSPKYDINGDHKREIIIEDTFPVIPNLTPIPYGSGFNTPMGVGSSDEQALGYNSLIPLMGSFSASNSYMSLNDAKSITSHGRSTSAFSNLSTNTAYSGNVSQTDMDDSKIYEYLMQLDYHDKKNPVKYDWKLQVDALNAFQFKVTAIDDYTDNDINKLITKTKEGLTNSIHDQRSGLIKVACNLFVLIAQYRTPLFFDREFFVYWMTTLLRKCANRDKIRTLPAHCACHDIMTHILLYYTNNKDHTRDELITKIKDIFINFASLWTLNNIDITWMKQVKSITQFIKNISLMIQSTNILNTNNNNNNLLLNINITNINDNNDKKEEEKQQQQITNIDIKEIQKVAENLFKTFMKNSHKEARECALVLLQNLYLLDKNRTFEFAKNEFTKRELTDFLKKLFIQQIIMIH